MHLSACLYPVGGEKRDLDWIRSLYYKEIEWDCVLERIRTVRSVGLLTVRS